MIKSKTLIPLALLALTFNASAADINCKGSVTLLMDYPPKCNGNAAFRTSSSNGKWICSASKNGDAIVLTALASKKTLEVYIDSNNSTFSCGTLPNYTPAKYIIINP